MAIIRNWRGRPRGLRELPSQVRDAARYNGAADWVIDVILLSVDGKWLKLVFENGRVDFWKQNEYAGWEISDAPPPWEGGPTAEAPTILALPEPTLTLN